jgi:magnesium transporter
MLKLMDQKDKSIDAKNPDNSNSTANSNETIIRFFCYDENNYEEKELTTIDKLSDLFNSTRVNWVDIVGTQDLELLKILGNNFNIHPLIIEDINITNQRLKIDYFPEYLFIVLKAVNYLNEEVLDLEQVSIILGKNFVFTFQELEPNQFIQIHDRIKNSKGRIRKLGADYLVYVILDVLVDNFFNILEDYGDRLDALQETLIQNPTPETLNEIHEFKKEIIKIRKATWPLREVISQLSKMDSDLFDQSIGIYIRDVYDHVIQIIDTIETFRDMISGMIDIFMSSVSNKMNEVMKVLTIIATIFIPLTFIAGVYGMNFQNMPELAWKWGYLTIIIIMVVIFVGMVFFFRRKKWI